MDPPLSRQSGGGERDSEVEALAYLQAVVGPYLDQARAEAFVGNAAKAFAHPITARRHKAIWRTLARRGQSASSN